MLTQSSFAVRDGRAYTMLRRNGRETVVCYRTDNGHEEWHYDYEVTYRASQGGGGPRSTPTLDGDRLYTVGVTGWLNCLDAKTGRPLWPNGHDLVAEFHAAVLVGKRPSVVLWRLPSAHQKNCQI